MKNMLFEDWGNLSRVSPRIVDRLTYRNKSNMGKNSKVEIFRGTPEQVWSKMNDKSQLDEGSLIAVIVRYEQDDLLLIKPDYDGFDFVEEEFLEIIPEYNDGFNYIPRQKAKAVAGLKTVIKWIVEKIINYIEKEKTNVFGLPKTVSKQDILSKINYQFIYSDIERKSIQNQRSAERTDSGTYFTKDGRKVLSNKAMNKDSLRYRLQNYINNKLPTFDNPKDIPTDLQKMNKNYAFKLFGCKYKYSDWKPHRYNKENTLEFIQGKEPQYLLFNNSDAYNGYHYYPEYIIFKIMFNKDTHNVEVSDVGFECTRKEYLGILGDDPTNAVEKRRGDDINHEDDKVFAPIELFKQYIDGKKPKKSE